MNFSLDNFINSTNIGVDKTLQIRNKSGILKYTLNPFQINTYYVNNNIIKIHFKSSDDIIELDFRTPLEAKEALKKLQQELDKFKDVVPNGIYEDIQNYVDNRISASTYSSNIYNTDGEIDSNRVVDLYNKELLFNSTYSLNQLALNKEIDGLTFSFLRAGEIDDIINDSNQGYVLVSRKDVETPIVKMGVGSLTDNDYANGSIYIEKSDGVSNMIINSNSIHMSSKSMVLSGTESMYLNVGMTFSISDRSIENTTNVIYGKNLENNLVEIEKSSLYNNVDYGTYSPEFINGQNKKGDTYILTSDGTSGGNVLSDYIFDGTDWKELTPQKDGKYLIIGGAAWSGSGYNYDVSVLSFYFNGYRTSNPTVITLNNGNDDDRIDAIVINISGTVSVIEGMPAPNPLTPEIPYTELLVQYVFVSANSTSPTVNQEIIYQENIEWVTSKYQTAVTADGTFSFSSSLSPKQGSVCIRGIDISDKSGIKFTRIGDININLYPVLSLWVRLNSTISTSKKLTIRFYRNNTAVGSAVNLFSYGVIRTTLGVWQLAVIPTQIFNASSNINNLRIIMTGNTDIVSWDVDNIILTEGSLPIISSNEIYIQNKGINIGSTDKINFIFGSVSFNDAENRIDVTANIPKWYGENVSSPSLTPLASGAGSIAFGDSAKAVSSNMFVYGNVSGYSASNAAESNFIGSMTGYEAINANHSNFIGYRAGFQASSADYSNFIGNRTGEGATIATVANFIGAGAGFFATNANHSNFIGYNAGNQATYANYANFLGRYAGYLAAYANNSIFIGQQTGYNAFSAFQSTFIGLNSGYASTYAACSKFIGSQAGRNSANAYNSIFIGEQSGYYDQVNNIPKVTYNGLIGTFIVGELINFSGGNSGRLISDGGGSMSFSLVFPNTPAISETISGVSSGAVAQVSSIIKNVGSSILIGSYTSTNGYSNSIAIGNGATNSSENQFVIGRTYNKWQIAGIDYVMPATQSTSTGSSLINDNGVLSWINIKPYKSYVAYMYFEQNYPPTIISLFENTTGTIVWTYFADIYGDSSNVKGWKGTKTGLFTANKLWFHFLAMDIDGNGGIGTTSIEYNSVDDIYFIPSNTLGIYYNLEIRIYN